ncbi:MAG: hypothetical protein ACFFBP_15430 [Promethearchaeota archaeon]
MLPPTEFIEGLFSLLYVIISTFMGILIASKYSIYRDNTFLYIGIASIGLGTTHWPSSVSFLTNVLLNQPLPEDIFLLTSSAFISFFLIIWIIGISNLLFDKKNLIFIILFVILHITMETIFLVAFFINPDYVGEVIGPYNLNAKVTTLMFVLGIINLLTIIITGFWAAVRSMKSTNRLIKLKGTFLFCSFLLWFIAIALEIRAEVPTIGTVIIRTLLIISVVGLYFGFVMPNIVQKFFIKINLLKPE